MKKSFFFTSTILACMVAIFTIAGCDKLESLFPASAGFCNFHQGQPTPVHMDFISYTTKQGTGTFTTSGGLRTSGTYTMVVEQINANSIHCTTTCVTPQGTFAILSDCQLDTMLGRWTISNDTGSYANLRGNGSLVMMVTSEGLRQETTDGNIY